MLSAVVLPLLLTLADPAAPSPPPPAPSLAPGPAPSAPAVTVVPFRTDAAPRIDPVFGDVVSFRAATDRFLALQGEMDRVRDEFSSAVHATLAALAGAGPGAGLNVTVNTAAEARQCPAAASAPYARALASGGRYLALGQQMQATYRELRRGDDLGETLGLTPDYRLKVKKAKDLHQQLLSDYREMRVAFYDQLGAEMRHAGCKLTTTAMTTGVTTTKAAAAPPIANPSDPNDWELADPTTPADIVAGGAAGGGASPRGPADAMPPHIAAARGTPPAPAEAPSAGVAPAIWIEVDNTLCNEPTRLSIDGQVQGEIGARNQTSVRARSGPHEVCALPASDRRGCGDPGTVRKAYLHEGWRLTIHCTK